MLHASRRQRGGCNGDEVLGQYLYVVDACRLIFRYCHGAATVQAVRGGCQISSIAQIMLQIDAQSRYCLLPVLHVAGLAGATS